MPRRHRFEHVRHQCPVVRDPLPDRRVRIDPVLRLREHLRELRQLVAIAAEHRVPLRRQRRADRAGAYVRIAVHVAADPRSERDDIVAWRRSLAVLRGQRFVERLVERRHHLVEGVQEVVEHVLALVLHRRPRGRVQIGLPDGGDVHADARGDRGALRRRERRIVGLDEQLGDLLLLREHGAAGGFGRVRGKDGLDPEPLHRAKYCVTFDVGLAQAAQGGLQPAGRR